MTNTRKLLHGFEAFPKSTTFRTRVFLVILVSKRLSFGRKKEIYILRNVLRRKRIKNSIKESHVQKREMTQKLF